MRESTLDTIREGCERHPEGAAVCSLELAGDLRRQQTVMFQPDPHREGVRELVEELPAGTLVVADLGYFGFAWFDWLRGYHWLSRLRAQLRWSSMSGARYSTASCGWEHTALIVPSTPFAW